MASIQDQIKTLQRRLAKIECYKTLIASFDGYLIENPEHEGLKAEIVQEVTAFLTALVSTLESEQAPVQAKASIQTPELTPDEIDRLRLIARKVAERTSGEPPTLETPRRPKLDQNDPLRFLMAHKHLDNQRVNVETKDGAVVGLVVGLDAPNVVVKTDLGYTIQVEPEKVSLQK